MATSAKIRWQSPIMFGLAAIGLIVTTCAVSQLLAGIGIQHGEGSFTAGHSALLGGLGSNHSVPPGQTRNEWGARRPRQETLLASVFAGIVQLCPVRQILHSSLVSDVKSFPIISALARIWHRGPPSSSLA